MNAPNNPVITGVHHVEVADRAALEAWMDRLDAAEAAGLDHHDARAAHDRCHRRPRRQRSSALRRDA
jgi:hypothetical protein